MTVSGIGVPTIEFDHHSMQAAHHRDELLTLVKPHPVFWTDSHGGYWVVTSHELIKRVLRDPATFSSLKTEQMTGGVTIPTVVGPRLIPAETDPPYHRTLRKSLVPIFNANAVKRLESELDEFITSVIDEVVAQGDFDVVADIANRIPAGSMVALLGFPERERVPFIKSVQAALDVMPHTGDPAFAASPQMQEGLEHFGHAVEVIRALIGQRRAAPADDIVSHLVSPELAFDDDEVMWLTFTLLVGGAENPAAMIGNSLLYLSQDTELRARLAKDHALIPAACEELLRHTSSAVSLARTATVDVQLEDALVHKGDRILTWLPAGNHDDAVFDNADTVDVDRGSCPHVAFGDGPHVCIGAPLFRAWFRILLREILTKMPDYIIDVEASQRFDDAATMWGWRTMPASTNVASGT